MESQSCTTSLAGEHKTVPEHWEIELRREISGSYEQPFVEHPGGTGAETYLAVNMDYKWITSLRNQIQRRTQEKLKDRGEAHITVINPLEYEVIKDKMDITEINQMARDMGIQRSKFTIAGIGRGQANLSDKSAVTYFLILESDELRRFREVIGQRYLKRGGDPKLFRFDHYYPHITIGFTERDLHEQDGVIKDKVHSLDPRFHLL